MKELTLLYEKIIDASDQADVTEHLKNYLSSIEELDREWSIYLLRGHGLKRLFSSAQLVELALDHMDFSPKIFERCLDFTSDTIEAISLVMPNQKNRQQKDLSSWIENISLNQENDLSAKIDFVLASWNNLDHNERYIFNKLITNTWRSSIPFSALTKSLSQYFNISIHQQAYNLFHTSKKEKYPIVELSKKHVHVNAEIFPKAISKSEVLDDISDLEDASDFICAFDWNGVRVQWIIQSDEAHLWTARGELITHKVPELHDLQDQIPTDTVIDGVLLAQHGDRILSKSVVRKRLSRKRITPKIATDIPLVFCAFDILKLNGEHIIEKSQEDRHAILQQLIESLSSNEIVQLSEETNLVDWDEINEKWKEAKLVNSSSLILKK